MECNIYKGKRKQDHYLFIPVTSPLDDIPGPILEMLGEIELVMQLDITEQSKLVQSDARAVLETISEKGFYIQLPSNNDITI
jgi:uncharacterized protein YcgL (UPF0745 family)